MRHTVRLGPSFPEGNEDHMQKSGGSELKQQRRIYNALRVGYVPSPSNHVDGQ